MSVEMLRKAAATLRERATAATPSPWVLADRTDADSPWYDEYDPAMVVDGTSRPGAWTPIAECDQGEDGRDATYIAMMHPGVGLALADWLDHCAQYDHANGWANTIARLIVGA